MATKSGSKTVTVNGKQLAVGWSVETRQGYTVKTVCADASDMGFMRNYPGEFTTLENRRDGTVKETRWVAGYYREDWDGEYVEYDADGDVVATRYCGQGDAKGWVFRVMND